MSGVSANDEAEKKPTAFYGPSFYAHATHRNVPVNGDKQRSSRRRNCIVAANNRAVPDNTLYRPNAIA
jgi:hypothetical protein